MPPTPFSALPPAGMMTPHPPRSSSLWYEASMQCGRPSPSANDGPLPPGMMPVGSALGMRPPIHEKPQPDDTWSSNDVAYDSAMVVPTWSGMAQPDREPAADLYIVFFLYVRGGCFVFL